MTSTNGHFVSQPLELHSDTQLDDSFDVAVDTIKIRIENFMHHASGWKVDGLSNVSINMMPYTPIKAGECFQIPQKLMKKRAIWGFNNNNDNKCFLYCVLAHRHISGKSQR